MIPSSIFRLVAIRIPIMIGFACLLTCLAALAIAIGLMTTLIVALTMTITYPLARFRNSLHVPMIARFVTAAYSSWVVMTLTAAFILSGVPLCDDEDDADDGDPDQEPEPDDGPPSTGKAASLHTPMEKSDDPTQPEFYLKSREPELVE